MNVSFKQNDPVNTLIIDSNTGAHLYQVKTPWKLSGRTTTIRRLNNSRGSSEPASQIRWRSFSADLVSVSGTQWTPVNDFLVRSGMFSSSRTFVAPNGKRYKWKKDGDKFSLVECETRRTVAHSHPRKLGWLPGRARKMNLDIMPQAISFLDLVLTSFIIMEKRKRDQNAQQAAASGGS